jgi:hypothetical protein
MIGKSRGIQNPSNHLILWGTAFVDFFLLAGALFIGYKIRQSAAQAIFLAILETPNLPLCIKCTFCMVYPFLGTGL